MSKITPAKPKPKPDLTEVMGKAEAANSIPQLRAVVQELIAVVVDLQSRVV